MVFAFTKFNVFFTVGTKKNPIPHRSKEAFWIRIVVPKWNNASLITNIDMPDCPKSVFCDVNKHLQVWFGIFFRTVVNFWGCFAFSKFQRIIDFLQSHTRNNRSQYQRHPSTQASTKDFLSNFGLEEPAVTNVTSPKPDEIKRKEEHL